MADFDKNIFKDGFFRVTKGVIISVLTTLVLLFLFSAILTFTNVQESTIKPVIIVISIISLLIGSSISTLKISKKGIINGGIVGIVYILIIYILSSIVGGTFNLNIESVVMISLSILAGMIGGIIGVNL